METTTPIQDPAEPARPLATPATLELANDPGQPNYLAAFLLTLFLGLLGNNRLYTGHYFLGWLRRLLFLSVFIAPVFFFIDITTGTIALGLAACANAVAILWWYIDLWIYFLASVHDKKTGMPLRKDSPRDYAYAKSMMTSLHLAVALLVVVIIVGVGLAANFIEQNPGIQDTLKTLETMQSLQDGGTGTGTGLEGVDPDTMKQLEEYLQQRGQ